MLGARTLDLGKSEFVLVQGIYHLYFVVVFQNAFGRRIVSVRPHRFSLGSLKLFFLLKVRGIRKFVFVSRLAIGVF